MPSGPLWRHSNVNLRMKQGEQLFLEGNYKKLICPQIPSEKGKLHIAKSPGRNIND